MYLSTLSIEGYKNFGKPFKLNLPKGLCVLVGENGTGKSAIIDALRLLLLEDEFGRTGVRDSDFHKPFTKGAKAAESIRICSQFTDLSPREQVAFLPWTDLPGDAQLTLHIENKQTNRGHFKRALWGGASKASMFEWELFDQINCIYLPPLRDAEAKLREGRGSRLARLLRNLNKEELKDPDEHPLVKKVRDFNDDLISDNKQAIAKANELIRTRLKEALGSVFGQDTRIQFAEANFRRIAEQLRLLFFPVIGSQTPGNMFRSLEQNSLGYNNLLYLASVLAELTGEREKDSCLRVLLIEEPEAHLHPQLQVRLLRYLEDTAKGQGIQVIVTTHSPVLSAAVSLDTMVHLSRPEDFDETVGVRISDCGLSNDSSGFIGRWLDATKSTLLFAKSVILVEGIAEALLLPKLAKRVLREYNKTRQDKVKLPESLYDCGTAVINMNGIYFKHFMQLFCDLEGTAQSLPVRCAGITDQDPPKAVQDEDGNDIKDEQGKKLPFKPTPSSKITGRNHALKLISAINKSEWARLYPNELKTFEYDLAMTGGNLAGMLPVASVLREEQLKIQAKLTKLAEHDWDAENDDSRKATAAYYLLTHIEKGEFAQQLAESLAEKSVAFKIPDNIRKAVLWACGGVDD